MTENYDLNQSCSSNTQFVQDVIIGNGYSIENFQNFLSTKKHNGFQKYFIEGHLLEIWTLDELLIVANEFQQYNPIFNDQLVLDHQKYQYPQEEESKQYPKVQIAPYSRRDSLKQNSITKCIEIYGQIQNSNQPQIFEAQKYKVTRECRKQYINPESPYSSQNCQVIMNQFTEIEGGILEKTYISYQILLQPSNILVNRRYSSFFELRLYLIKTYTEFIIPPLPQKNAKNSHLPLVRMQLLERFMNRILQQIEFRADTAIQAFLSDISDEQFISLVKLQVKKFRSINVEQIQNPQGFLNLEISNSITKYLSSVKENNNIQEDIIRKIRKQTKIVIKSNTTLQNDLKDLANLFSNLMFNLQAVNIQNYVDKNIQAEGVNIVLNNLFMRWGAKIKEQNNLLKKHVVDFYSFNKEEFVVIKDKIDMLDYARLNHHLLDCLNQSQQVDKVRDNFAYINHKVFEQVKLVHESGAKEIAQNFISFSKGMVKIFEEELFWQDVISAMKLIEHLFVEQPVQDLRQNQRIVYV